MSSEVWPEMTSRTMILESSLRSFKVSWVRETKRWDRCHEGRETTLPSPLGLLSCRELEVHSLAFGRVRQCCGGDGSSTRQLEAIWPAPPQRLHVRRYRHSAVLWVERRQCEQLGEIKDACSQLPGGNLVVGKWMVSDVPGFLYGVIDEIWQFPNHQCFP